MKTSRIIFVLAVALMAASCIKDDDRNYLDVFDATVTFRPQADSTFYLKQDDSTALVVLNESLKKYPFKKLEEKRAVVQYYYDAKEQNCESVPGYKYTKAVTLAYIDTLSIREPNVYDAAKEENYGKDEIGVYVNPMYFPTTMVEDGYLNIFFVIPYGMMGVGHDVFLLTGVNPEDPYEVELRHNAHGDISSSTIYSTAAFSLKSLPDTGGKTVKLTLKWNSMVTGETEKMEYDYCTRTDW